MQDQHQGVLTRIRRLCYEDARSRIYILWCGLHQLDIIMKKAMNNLFGGDCFKSMTKTSIQLTRQKNV